MLQSTGLCLKEAGRCAVPDDAARMVLSTAPGPLCDKFAHCSGHAVTMARERDEIQLKAASDCAVLLETVL